MPVAVPEDAFAPDVVRGEYHARTVLPHAALGYRQGDRGVAPHDAVLWIPREFIKSLPGEPMPGLELIEGEAMTWKMHSVELYVPQATMELVTTRDFERVPKLTDCARVLSLQLDPRVVANGAAAAVFDLFGGVLDAYKNPLVNDARQATFTVETTGEETALSVTRMWDRAQSRIELQPAMIRGVLYPPHVFVTNTGREIDQDIDFFLHYLVTTWTPPADQEPPVDNGDGIRSASDSELVFLRDLPGGVTFGCSNSVYP